VNDKAVSILGIIVAIAVALALAVAGSENGVRVGGIPLFALAGAIAFFIQWTMFVPAFVFQTERYYDVTGSLTYILLTLLALSVTGANDVRTVVIGMLVILWACRLGTFLFVRIRASGEDRRFRSIKPNPLQFLMTWTLQGLWVFVTFGAGLAAMTSQSTVAVDAFLVVGVALWFCGFVIEVVADRQKSAFRAIASNRDRFITSGLWAWSRHPNYFGEILLWIGIAVIALPVLQGWQYATLVSPVFVFILLTRISGVRMLENRANRQWGQDEDYRRYRASTPMLVPRPPRTA